MTKNNQLGSNLIFMIGLPRSGTTFLQRILDKHPDVYSVPEPWIMLHPIYALKWGGVSAEFDSSLARQALHDFLMTLSDGEQVYIEAIRNMGASIYEKALRASGKKYFLDKTPRYYFITTELLRVFPEAKFVFLLRNPLAILSSVLETWFDNHIELMPPYYFLDLVKGPKLMLNAIRQFREQACVVHYEALVQNPNPIISDLCKYLNIPFIEDMIEYRSPSVFQETAKGRDDYLQNNGRIIEDKWVGKFGDQKGVFQYNKPVTDSLNKWITNLSSSAELLDFAQEYLDVLGDSVLTEMGYSFEELSNILQESRQKYSEEQVSRIRTFEWSDWQKTGDEREQVIAQLQEQIKWHENHNVSEMQYYEQMLDEQKQQIDQDSQIVKTQQEQIKWHENHNASEKQYYEQMLDEQKQRIEQHERTIAGQQQRIGDLAELNIHTEISVVLGSYNRRAFLKLAIESIRKELDDLAHEIIVVDGGSTDGSLDWLTRQKDIITIAQHNRGEWRGQPIPRHSWGYFMNLAFKSAQGKYVCMLSDDCLVIPCAIWNGYKLFEEKLQSGEKIGAIAFYYRDWPIQEKYHICCTPAEYMYVNHGLYLNQALKDIGYADEESFQFYAADMDICMRMRQGGYLIIDSPDSYIEHYAHANVSVRSSNDKFMAVDVEAQHRVWKKYMVDGETGHWRPSAMVEKEHHDPTNTAQQFKHLHRTNPGGVFNKNWPLDQYLHKVSANIRKLLLH